MENLFLAIHSTARDIEASERGNNTSVGVENNLLFGGLASRLACMNDQMLQDVDSKQTIQAHSSTCYWKSSFKEAVTE
jgi:hypothetical protein